MEEQNNTQQEQATPTPAPVTVSGNQSNQSDVEKNKTMAILAYFIFFLPLITDAKDSPFAKFHANQSLILLLTGVLGNIVLGLIPFLGWFLMVTIFPIAIFVLFIMGIINASNGQMKELPLIGGIHLLDK